MDDPHTILQGALDNHYQMVKQFKGTSLLIERESSIHTNHEDAIIIFSSHCACMVDP